ncbi:MAG TPA: GNAT family N-acetyltransferase [Stellaceae bacterium]|nr:GNAT family N-acetyltransferase [Stellaceae bacterium]
MGDVTSGSERSTPRFSAPVPLSADHNLELFDCGHPTLNDWLRHRALKNESRFSRTYVVCEGMRVVAYFCISAGAVARQASPGKLRRNAPETIPVAVIGRLAVDRDYAGKGLGAGILSDALRRVAAVSESIGVGAVLVEAKDDAAKRFYLKFAEFLEYPAGSRTLFLPIETIIAAFG